MRKHSLSLSTAAGIIQFLIPGDARPISSPMLAALMAEVYLIPAVNSYHQSAFHSDYLII